MLARGVRALHPRSLLTLLTRSCCCPPPRRLCAARAEEKLQDDHGQPRRALPHPSEQPGGKGCQESAKRSPGAHSQPRGGVIVLQEVRSRAELTP